MATTFVQPLNHINTNFNTTKPRQVCFSFAAYARNLIDHLIDNNVPVAEGLTDCELDAVESVFNFKFPPDLRHILQEGLLVGPGFPNWRSSSQVEILLNLPILGICKEISRHNFWVKSWGDKPENIDEAVKLAKGLLKNAPVLVPIYRNFHIPANPNLAGNPVFFVNGSEIRVWSFDIAGFFQRFDFGSEEGVRKRPSLSSLMNAPAWAATEARRVEFWSDISAAPAVDRGGERRWWSGGELVGCMEEVCRRLRDGGWREEEVREMTMMNCGDERDHGRRNSLRDTQKFFNQESVRWHLRILSLRLLRVGWSREDVVDSLGWHVESERSADVESLLEIRHLKYLNSGSLEAV